MIKQNFITKIEGHGDLEIDFKNETVKLLVHEGERLFEGILVGREANEAHFITPRICGVCPIAHNLASLASLESAYGIKLNKTSQMLRLLMKCGQNIQSHVLHLFFLALPDYLGIDSALDLAKKNRQVLENAIALKGIGDEIAFVSAGRNVHPTTTVIGGFNKIPDEESLRSLLFELEKTEHIVLWALNLISKLPFPELKTDLELVAIKKGKIVSNYSASVGVNKKETISIKNYKENINEEIKSYSTAKFGKLKNKEIMVGSLARLALSKNAEIYKKKYKINFNNPFHNILAQAIELKKYHKMAKNIIKKLLETGQENIIVKPPQNPPLKGIGAVEAPRGGLYHEVHLNENGIITYANIITPTVQNLSSIEKTAADLLRQSKNKSESEKKRLITMLVRAYDPCLSCSAH